MIIMNLRFKNNRGFVLAAVKQNGFALSYVPDLQNDREIVLAAVRQNGRAIRFASPELQHDLEILLAAAGVQPAVI
jgi:hypothetical protein